MAALPRAESALGIAKEVIRALGTRDRTSEKDTRICPSGRQEARALRDANEADCRA